MTGFGSYDANRANDDQAREANSFYDPPLDFWVYHEDGGKSANQFGWFMAWKDGV